MNFFIERLFNPDQSRFFVLWVVMVMCSISFHEFSHAWVAQTEGDPTPAATGHYTLNPMRQMGMLSIIMLALIGFAWGAVPTNPTNFRSRWSHFRVAVAGPMMNLVLIVAFGVLYLLADMLGALLLNDQMTFALLQLFYIGTWVNALGLILNLLPVPMLDGWTVWQYLIPPLRRVAPSWERVAGIAGIIFVVFGFSLIWGTSRLAAELICGLSDGAVIDPYATGAGT